MSREIQTLEVLDLDNLGKASLRPFLASKGSAKSDAFGSDGHGDLGLTTAIVIVSLAAIKALAPVLVRQRRRHTLKKVDNYIDKDGVAHAVMTDVTIEASWSEAEVIQALGDATKVDVAPLLEGIKSR